jgi:hypothetical protein
MTETQALPETVRLYVTHLHAGNSTGEQRRGREYLTIARVVDRETNEVLTYAEATCNPHDSPNRKRGYHIATERAKKQFFSLT